MLQMFVFMLSGAVFATATTECDKSTCSNCDQTSCLNLQKNMNSVAHQDCDWNFEEKSCQKYQSCQTCENCVGTAACWNANCFKSQNNTCNDGKATCPQDIHNLDIDVTSNCVHGCTAACSLAVEKRLVFVNDIDRRDDNLACFSEMLLPCDQASDYYCSSRPHCKWDKVCKLTNSNIVTVDRFTNWLQNCNNTVISDVSMTHPTAMILLGCFGFLCLQ
jgi:hypothetical protein